jgi:fructose-1,6-bisphosphatase/sedoheptulose 1,7-bisphosphatase-like protein
MVGFGAILIAGCPFRQLVLASSGDLDAAAAVAGMLAAAGLSVTLGIGSSPEGVTAAGKFAVLVGWVFFLALALRNRKGV